jgi:hypothetical protein
VRAVRERLDGIRQEAEKAQPYPGSNHWQAELTGLARRLDPIGSPTKGPYRWFYRSLQGFGSRDRASAVETLTDLGRRLETAEQNLAALAEKPADGPASGPARSKEEIKDLVSKRVEPEAKEQAAPRKVEPDDVEIRRPEVRRDGEGPADGGGGAPQPGPGMVPAMPGGGFGVLAWLVVGGVLLAIIVLAVVLLIQQRSQAPPVTQSPQSGNKAPSLDDVLSRPEPKTAGVLWRQAEELAAAGNYLEAVRLLYAAVLAQLHRASLIRYEATRTNGEYLDQVRAGADAEGLHETFRRLTGLFELKWYGERRCQAEDYQSCRGLAEEIRGLV